MLLVVRMIFLFKYVCETSGVFFFAKKIYWYTFMYIITVRRQTHKLSEKKVMCQKNIQFYFYVLQSFRNVLDFLDHQMVRQLLKFLKQKSELKKNTYGIFHVENSNVIKITRQSSFEPVAGKTG